MSSLADCFLEGVLWRRDRSIRLTGNNNSWFSEFKIITYLTPCTTPSFSGTTAPMHSFHIRFERLKGRNGGIPVRDSRYQFCTFVSLEGKDMNHMHCEQMSNPNRCCSWKLYVKKKTHFSIFCPFTVLARCHASTLVLLSWTLLKCSTKLRNGKTINVCAFPRWTVFANQCIGTKWVKSQSREIPLRILIVKRFVRLYCNNYKILQAGFLMSEHYFQSKVQKKFEWSYIIFLHVVAPSNIHMYTFFFSRSDRLPSCLTSQERKLGGQFSNIVFHSQCGIRSKNMYFKFR